MKGVSRYLRKLTCQHLAETLSDRELLERFVATKDEVAFEAIIRRHGPMVLAVCRRALRCRADVDDAFQATFLVLLCKSRSIVKKDALGSWLHGVAYKISLRARSDQRRRQVELGSAAEPTISDGLETILVRELAEAVDREINRLGEPFQNAFVLCCLEGKSYRQAARLLGCPEGTVSSRVVRARERLRSRLAAQGLALSAGVLMAGLSQIASAGPLPPVLAGAALDSLRYAVTGGIVKGTLKANLLAHGVITSMFLAKVRIVAGVALFILAGAGVATLTGPREIGAGSVQAASGDTAGNGTRSVPATKEANLVSIVSPMDGVFQLAEVEKAVQGTVTFGKPVNKTQTNLDRVHRKLHIGDHVRKGDLLAYVYSQESLNEIKKAEAELKIAVVKQEQAARLQQNLDVLINHEVVKPDAVKELTSAKKRFNQELEKSTAAVEAARWQVDKSRKKFEKYPMSSTVSGIIHEILATEGKVVTKNEVVFVIRPNSEEEVVAPKPAEVSPDLVRVASPREGLILAIGTEIKEGDKVPADRVEEVKSGNTTRRFRILREGDAVQKGQVLVQLDDRLSRIDIGIKQAKIESAEAEAVASEKTRDEAYQRYLTQERKYKESNKATSLEDLRGSKLTHERYKQEVVGKKANVKVAQLEVEQARAIADMYAIRSPVMGVVKKIEIHPGEAVKALETVLVIEKTKDAK